MAGGGRQRANSRLVALLAGGRTVEAAASEVGISERTVYRRLEDPEFRLQLGQLRGHMLQLAAAQLADSSTEAAQTLRALLSASSETVRLGAARAILELGTRFREAAEGEEQERDIEVRYVIRKLDPGEKVDVKGTIWE